MDNIGSGCYKDNVVINLGSEASSKTRKPGRILMKVVHKDLMALLIGRLKLRDSMAKVFV